MPPRRHPKKVSCSLPVAIKETKIERREDYYRDFCKSLKGDVHFSQPKRVKVERGSLRDDADTKEE